MPFEIPAVLENDRVMLHLIGEEDFEELYAVASDPLIWEQHPNRDRWKKEVFRNFFEGALATGSAYRIVDKASNKTAGCTRFYDYDEKSDTIHVGYTFYGRDWWGTGLNRSAKKLMLDYAFRYVERVCFHIGATNIRSQVAIMRLGARKTGELEIAYYGEPVRLNYVYEISKTSFQPPPDQRE